MQTNRSWRARRTGLVIFAGALGWIAVGACSAPAGKGSSGDGVGNAPADDSTSPDSSTDLADDGLIFDDGLPDGGTFTPTPTAFPSTPVLDGVDASVATAFANVGEFTPGSVCVFEPHLSDGNGPGALFPMNWLRPRFRWTGSGTETSWEIRLSAESQSNDLVIYTNKTQWTMPNDLWEKISKGVPDDITVTIRGNAGGGLVGMSGTFRITSALAGGSMVFWGTSTSVVEPGSSQLYGFTMGDEAVAKTLSAEQVTGIQSVMQANGRDLRGENVGSYAAGFNPGVPRCIGCHSATPDGTAMAFTDDYPWNMGMASVDAMTAPGAPPTYLTPAARELMKIPFLGTAAMLATPWAAGDRTMITTMGQRSSYIYIDYSAAKPEPTLHDLVWMDLAAAGTIPSAVPAAEGAPTVPWPDATYSGYQRQEAAQARETAILGLRNTAWGILATEPGKSVSVPAAAKKGLQIAYVVTDSTKDGHPDWHANTADIKILNLTSPRVPAGAAAPLAGASDPTLLEYYPAYSPDDQFIAFTRAPTPSVATRCAQNPDASPPCINNPASLGENPDGPYYNRKGEIFVVPAAGGTPHRLRGNDPVMCGGEVSPGVNNSWPKWSSAVRTEDGKTYYFVIFSSTRAYPDQFNLTPTKYTPPIDTRSSQLYMSVIEHDPATQTMTSYAAIYLWNQNYVVTGPDSYEELKTANLTPAWEDFTIPTVPPTVIVK